MQTGTFTKKYEYCLGVNELVEVDSNVQKSSRIRFDASITDYFTKAVHNELKFMGYKLTSTSNTAISGKISKCWLDKTSSNTGKVVFEVRFIIRNTQLNKNVYDEVPIGEFIFTDGEHIDIPTSIYTAASRAIENFVMSAQGAGVLGY